MRQPGHGRHVPRAQRGAALLIAMIVLTLVATLASNMVWQQWRAVEVEGAERARVQAAWLLNGALDWARLILREDVRGADYIGEPWSLPLAEARLSTFLAVERASTSDDGPPAFLSGNIVDAQSRYNLRNLLQADEKLAALEAKSLGQLCEALGLGSGVAETLRAGLLAAWRGGDPADAVVAPRTLSQLRWLGVDSSAIERLAKLTELLPEPTAVNLNTAPREVLAAVIEGLDLASADRLIQARGRSHFQSLDDAQAQLPPGAKLDARRVGVTSNYFEVHGRLRLEQRVLNERSLIQRRANREVLTILRERVSTRTDLQ